MKTILFLLSLLGAIAIGAYGYYLYADHMFNTYPEYIISVCERKLQKREAQS